MILEFYIENFRSFRDHQTFSMIPDEGKQESTEHIVEVSDKYQALRSAVVYGANASGKSNFMRALQALRNIVISSADLAPDQEIESYDPFRFNPRTAGAPTVFEVDFLIDKVRYHYLAAFTKKKIVEERLLFYPEGRESKLFIRKGQNFEFGDYLKGQKAVISRLTGKNQLFLSKAVRNNLEQLEPVYQFFAQHLMPIPFLDSWVDNRYIDRIAKELTHSKSTGKYLENFTRLIKSFDTGIHDFKIKKPTLPLSGKEYEISIEHDVFDDAGEKKGFATFPIEEESAGTQKLFVLGGLILRALMNGRIIVIDEFERSLHPLVSSYLIQLFHDPGINTKGAQLILATHDTNLLSSNAFRRDQIWIVEKDQSGASELFSLADVRGILKDAPYEKWYLSGRLGGIPSIQRLDFELNYTVDEKE